VFVQYCRYVTDLKLIKLKIQFIICAGPIWGIRWQCHPKFCWGVWVNLQIFSCPNLQGSPWSLCFQMFFCFNWHDEALLFLWPCWHPLWFLGTGSPRISWEGLPLEFCNVGFTR
jgi:hypothetical protein